jgi:hypothetical protein
MDMKRLILHVDRLVLNGFRSDERHALAESLRGELTRSLGRRETVRLLASRRNVARLALPVLRVPAATKVARVGERIAHAIARGMKS